MPWVTSMICASGAIRLITPWQVPTKSSWSPKSVRKLTNTRRRLSPPAGRRRRASRPPRPPRRPPRAPPRRLGPMLTAGSDAEPTECARRRGGREHHEIAVRERGGSARASGRADEVGAELSTRDARALRGREEDASRRTRAARRADLPGSRRPGPGRRRRRRPRSPRRSRRPAPACPASAAAAPGAVRARDDHPVVAGDVDRIVAERLDLDQRAAHDLVPERLDAAASSSSWPGGRVTTILTRRRRGARARPLRIDARAPLDPGAVLVGDERGQRRAVVVRGDRGEAAAADERDAAALGLDAPARLGVVGRRDESLLAGAHLERERALARLGKQLRRVEAMPDLAPRPSRSSPHAASTIASRPRSPRLRSRVSMLPRSGSIESVGSSASSCARRRADAVPMRMPGRSRAPQSASRGSSRTG